MHIHAPIFDSTLSINEINTLNYNFISASLNLYNGLSQINDDIPLIIYNNRQKLKDDISTFLIDSHDLLQNLFLNLNELTNAFSSKKSKIAEISSYYLNYTDTSYTEIIKNAKEIIDNYYINEINLILPSFYELINKFPENTIKFELKNVQNNLDNINNRLENGSLLIESGTNDELQYTISNLYNSNIKFNSIINNVQQRFIESINIQSNGYFETQKDIDDKKKSYGLTAERAMNISYTLDNNELIDKKF